MIKPLELKKNHLIVSRAATAIYLILKSQKIYKQKILVPANICYAAVYPIIYSGNYPVFCDADADSGNVTYEHISKKICDIAAVILPHMYGNPIQDIKDICNLCRKKSVLIIEDCASSMGAETPDGPCGSFGDYVLYSMGYSKTIDLGYGGILASDYDLSMIEAMYKKLPLKTEDDEENEAFFSKQYRLIRNSRKQTISKYIWNALYDNLQTVFVHRMTISEEKIITELDKLEAVISQRRTDEALYSAFLSKNAFITDYAFSKGAVPWRYCFFVPPEKKDSIVSYCLEKKLPVSDWYPDVTSIFNYSGSFEGIRQMEEKILNFPLLIGKEKIDQICSNLNNFR
ncbi:MAG: DegT/DnrJ/EryC1/StrS family aminotransferase [Ruminiclostridium sp.]